MDIPLLRDFVIIAGLGIVVLLVCSRLHVPTLVGFLITGAIAGPHGLRLLRNVHEVEVLAEIGVITLLFTIGLELSLGHVLRMRRLVVGAGAIQVASTSLVIYVLMRLFSLPFEESVVIGFLVAMSSTAVVLKLLQERGDLERPHGQATFGILLFQDILIIPLMLLLPTLAGGIEGEASEFTWAMVRAALFIAAVVFASRYVVPRLLFLIVRAKSHELFLVSVAGICFAVAIIAREVGLSLALGALFAGISISESEYSHEAFSRVQPFRDVFASLFFVSIGMLINLQIVMEFPVVILACSVGLIVLKTALAGVAAYLIGVPFRSAFITGISLAQLGEFSFLLSKEALQLNIISDGNYQIFLSCSVLSIAATPFLLQLAPQVATWLLSIPLIHSVVGHQEEGSSPDGPSQGEVRDHIIIVGFGINGRSVAQAAEQASIPHCVIELNPETVRNERQLGRRIQFGDASQEGVLRRADIEKARVLVVVVAEAIATRRIVAAARKMNPNLYIIARTRLVAETVPLYKEGANEVISEEYEVSIEVFARVLFHYSIPEERIEALVRELRANGYQMFRRLSKDESDGAERPES